MKKRLLTFALAAAMLTESVLPVVAADDVEVSANEAVAEEAAEETVVEKAAVEEDAVVTEEAVIEETAETVDADYEVVAEGSIEAYVVDGKISQEKILESLQSEDVEILDVYEENGEIVVKTLCQISVAGQDEADIEIGEAEIAEATNAYYMYPTNKTYKTYNAGAFDVFGTSVALTATVDYYQTIYYRTRAVKPLTDLQASVRTDSGIYTVARKLVPAGYTFDPEVIKWKFSPKKNKNAGSDSRFIVKASVNSKIAKQMGIKGKSLSLLKKAVKTLNKEMKYVKKKEGIDNRVSFTIKPLVFDDIKGGMTIYVYHYYGWGGTRVVLSPIYCRLEASQPEVFNKKKWSKIPKKEYKTKMLNNGAKIEVIPKQKNLVGNSLLFE